jgi:hypothetical protein
MDQAEEDQVVVGWLHEPVQLEASNQIVSLGHPEQSWEQGPLVSNPHVSVVDSHFITLSCDTAPRCMQKGVIPVIPTAFTDLLSRDLLPATLQSMPIRCHTLCVPHAGCFMQERAPGEEGGEPNPSDGHRAESPNAQARVAPEPAPD